MSSVAEINQALAEQLQLIDGLRVFDWQPDTLNPPAAVIMPPRPRNYPADRRSGHGDLVTEWAYRIPITLVVGRVGEREWARQYDHFCDEVQEVIPKADLCHVFVAQIPQIRQITVGGADYIAGDVVVECWAP